MATYSLALLKWQKAQPNAAITLLNELLVENPRFPIPEDSSIVADARVMLAEIYAQLGDYSRAERLYREVSNDPRHRIAALFGRAWALFKQGRSDETASLCRKLLVEPGLGERAAGTLFLLGAALYEARKYQEAIDPLRRAVVHPDIGEFQTQAWFRLVWSLFLTGDQERAAREAKRLLKLRLDPALAGDVHFVLAQIAAASSRYETAATEYRTVVDQYPASRFREKAAFGLGQTEYLLRAYDRAARAFEAFIEEYPDSPLYDEALRWLVESLVQIGEHEEAAVRTAELLQRNPAHKDLPRLLYSQGLSLYKSGRIEEMCGPLEKLLDRFPQSRYAPEALYWLAWHDDQAGNTDQAIQEFERLVKEYPKSGYLYAAYRRLIVGYIEREKFDQALPMLLAMLSNADEVKVIGAEIFFRLAIYASDQGRHEDAVRILTAVAEIHPNPAVEERALIERGRELIWIARWQEALDCAERLLSKYPQTLFLPEAHWVRARAFNGMDRLEEAAEAFDDSLQSLVNVGSTDRFFEATVHLDRGKLLEARGMIEEALKEYLYVDILFPGPKTSPQAILRGADIQKRLGKEKEARQMLERLVQTYPNAPEAQQARLRLRDLLSQAE